MVFSSISDLRWFTRSNVSGVDSVAEEIWLCNGRMCGCTSIFEGLWLCGCTCINGLMEEEICLCSSWQCWRLNVEMK